MLVVPAIIPRTKEQLEEEIKIVSPFAKLVQIDISDGIFTPFKTWPYNGRDTDYFEKLKTEEEGLPKWEDLEFEVHLMVKSPEDVVSDWVNIGVASVITHVEATDNFQKVIDICKEKLVSVGIAIKPSTDISRLEPFLSQVDFIQVMGSDELGKHGVELDTKALDLIKLLKKNNPMSMISVDIGVNEDTAQELIDAGANKLVSGSAIIEAESPQEAFQYFQSLD